MSNKLWDDEYRSFQDAIKQIRVKAGMTQVELSAALDKPQSYVSKYERGERKLDFIETMSVCEACGVTVTQFHNVFSKLRK